VSAKRPYEGLTSVEIVRPDPAGADLVVRLVEFALSAWVVMLALGALLPFPAAHLSYLHTVLGLWAVRCLLPGSDYVYWTRARRRMGGRS
jgi:hypothetical protein